MIKLAPTIYYGPAAKVSARRWKRIVKHCNPIPGVYVLVRPENESHMLEIYPLVQMVQAGMQYRDYYVVGIAIGKQEALELVQSLVQESCDRMGAANLKEFLGI